MSMSVSVWSEVEQAVARRAFDAAYARSLQALIGAVRRQAEQLESVDSIWRLHDFLSIQRHQIEGRFDFRLEGLLFVFASLVKEGLLDLEELEGLDDEKLGKVSAMARF